MAKRKSSSRVDLSIVQKVAKLDAYHALTPEFKKSQRTAAEKLGISRGGLRNLLDKEALIREEAKENGNKKRHRSGKGGFKTPDVIAAPGVAAADVLPPPLGIDEEDIDADVEVTDKTSEGDFEQNLVTEIIQKEAVKNGGKADEEVVDDDEDEEPVPTAAQMRAALYTLQRGLQASDFTKFDDFWCLEKDIREHLRMKFPPKKLTLDRFF